MLFTFPSRYSSLSVSRSYLAFPRGRGQFRQDSSCPALLRMRTTLLRLRLRGCHPLRPAFPCRFGFATERLRPSYNPADAETSEVWATPVSLAATRGIDCSFFSSAYLDVSVQRVCRLSSFWVVPFGDPGVIAAICASTRLFAACHVLRRRRDPRHPPCALLFFLHIFFLTHVRFCLFFCVCLHSLPTIVQFLEP